jgi:hypothetical protein
MFLFLNKKSDSACLYMHILYSFLSAFVVDELFFLFSNLGFPYHC